MKFQILICHTKRSGPTLTMLVPVFEARYGVAFRLDEREEYPPDDERAFGADPNDAFFFWADFCCCFYGSREDMRGKHEETELANGICKIINGYSEADKYLELIRERDARAAAPRMAYIELYTAVLQLVNLMRVLELEDQVTLEATTHFCAEAQALLSGAMERRCETYVLADAMREFLRGSDWEPNLCHRGMSHRIQLYRTLLALQGTLREVEDRMPDGEVDTLEDLICDLGDLLHRGLTEEEHKLVGAAFLLPAPASMDIEDVRVVEITVEGGSS